MKKNAKRYDVLLVGDHANKNLFRASSNLEKAKAIDAASLNVFDVLNHKNLFMEKEAVATIAKHYKDITMADVFLIKKPWVTEKSTGLATMGKYVFMVKSKATKPEIKKGGEGDL